MADVRRIAFELDHTHWAYFTFNGNLETININNMDLTRDVSRILDDNVERIREQASRNNQRPGAVTNAGIQWSFNATPVPVVTPDTVKSAPQQVLEVDFD